MSDLTKRGIRALALGIVLLLVSVGLAAANSEGVTALVPIVDLAAGVLILIGLVLTVVGLFRRT